MKYAWKPGTSERLLREALDQHWGETAGRLTVIFVHRVIHKGHNRLAVMCTCECGAGKDFLLSRWKCNSSRPESCGCLKIEKTTRHGHAGSKGQTPTYQSWHGMFCRCYLEKTVGFSEYGGRGITVCDRWRSDFATFLEDMGERPSKAHTLDRIDPNGNYEPGNCRWATKREQSLNRRNNRLVLYEGELMPATEAARRAGLSPSSVLERIRQRVHPDFYFVPSQRSRRLPRVDDAPAEAA